MIASGLFRRRPSRDSTAIRGLQIVPPAPLPGRHGLAVVAMVRDAGAYLEEWLAFHARAGVAHFFVYDNLSSDRTAAILSAHAARGTLTRIPWALNGSDAETGRRLSPQTVAYGHAVATFGNAFERFAFIDHDEFLVPRRGNDLMEEVRRAGSPSNLSLPWHMFGHNGHKTPPPDGVIAGYTARARLPYAEPEILLNFKCIVDPCKLTRIWVHRFETVDMGDRTANTRGEIATNGARNAPGFFSSEGIQLNHYYTRSEAEFAAKAARGSGNFASPEDYRRRLARKVAAIERDTEQDFAAQAFLGREPAVPAGRGT